MTESTHEDPILAKRIWAGDETAIEDARRKYEADPEGQFVSWVSTLFSFREHEERRAELRPLLEPLVLLWARPQLLRKFTVVELDVLSTVLLWAADAFRVPAPETLVFSMRAIDTVDAMVGLGRKLSREAPLGGHSYELLTLTDAALRLRHGDHASARAFLAIVWKRATAIRDVNQKARVYRKLGVLYLKLRNPVGFWFIARALLVKGAAKGTRKKTWLFWHR